MKKLYIVGAGGFGRELLQWVKDINAVTPTWEIVGFLDENLNALDGVACDYPVVGKISTYVPTENEVLALAIGDPHTKEKLVNDLESRGATFTSVIHPTATLTAFSEYGEGLIMFPWSKLSVNSSVGKHVTIMSSGVGHDVRVGDYCTICSAVTLIRNVVIGNHCYIASNVAINADVHVGNDCYIGMGSMVIKDVADGMKTFCSPARTMPM